MLKWGIFLDFCVNVLIPISKSDQKLKANKKNPDKITFLNLRF